MYMAGSTGGNNYDLVLRTVIKADFDENDINTLGKTLDNLGDRFKSSFVDGKQKTELQENINNAMSLFDVETDATGAKTYKFTQAVTQLGASALPGIIRELQTFGRALTDVTVSTKTYKDGERADAKYATAYRQMVSSGSIAKQISGFGFSSKDLESLLDASIAYTTKAFRMLSLSGKHALSREGWINTLFGESSIRNKVESIAQQRKLVSLLDNEGHLKDDDYRDIIRASVLSMGSRSGIKEERAVFAPLYERSKRIYNPNEVFGNKDIQNLYERGGKRDQSLPVDMTGDRVIGYSNPLYRAIRKLQAKDQNSTAQQLAIESGLARIEKADPSEMELDQNKDPGILLRWNNDATINQMRLFLAKATAEGRKIRGGKAIFKRDADLNNNISKAFREILDITNIFAEQASDEISGKYFTDEFIIPAGIELEKLAKSTKFTQGGYTQVQHSVGKVPDYAIPYTTLKRNADNSITLIPRSQQEMHKVVTRTGQLKVKSKDAGIMIQDSWLTSALGYKPEHSGSYGRGYDQNGDPIFFENSPDIVAMPLEDTWVRNEDNYYLTGNDRAKTEVGQMLEEAIDNGMVRYGSDGTELVPVYSNGQSMLFANKKKVDAKRKADYEAGLADSLSGYDVFAPGGYVKGDYGSTNKQLTSRKRMGTQSRLLKDILSGYDLSGMNYATISLDAQRRINAYYGNQVFGNKLVDGAGFIDPAFSNASFQVRGLGYNLKGVLGNYDWRDFLRQTVKKTDKAEQSPFMEFDSNNKLNKLLMPNVSFSKLDEQEQDAIIKAIAENTTYDNKNRETLLKENFQDVMASDIAVLLEANMLKGKSQMSYVRAEQFKNFLVKQMGYTEAEAEAEEKRRRSEQGYLRKLDVGKGEEEFIRLKNEELNKNIKASLDNDGGLRAVKTEEDFSTGKRTIGRQLADAIGFNQKMREKSAKLYAEQFEKMEDDLYWIEEDRFSSRPDLQQAFEAADDKREFLKSDKAVKYIQGKKKALQKQSLKRYMLDHDSATKLAFPFIGSFFEDAILNAGAEIDPEKDLSVMYSSMLSNRDFLKTRFGFDDKTLKMLEDENGNIDATRMLFSPDAKGAWQIVGRTPSSLNTFMKMLNIGSNRKIRNAFSQLRGGSSDISMMLADAMDYMNTGDFDGDTVWMYAAQMGLLSKGLKEANKSVRLSEEDNKELDDMIESQLKALSNKAPKDTAGARQLDQIFDHFQGQGEMGKASQIMRNAVDIYNASGKTKEDKEAFAKAYQLGSKYYDKATSEGQTMGWQGDYQTGILFDVFRAGKSFDRFQKIVSDAYDTPDEDLDDNIPSIFSHRFKSLNNILAVADSVSEARMRKARGGLDFGFGDMVDDLIERQYGAYSENYNDVLYNYALQYATFMKGQEDLSYLASDTELEEFFRKAETDINAEIGKLDKNNPVQAEQKKYLEKELKAILSTKDKTPADRLTKENLRRHYMQADKGSAVERTLADAMTLYASGQIKSSKEISDTEREIDHQEAIKAQREKIKVVKKAVKATYEGDVAGFINFWKDYFEPINPTTTQIEDYIRNPVALPIKEITYDKNGEHVKAGMIESEFNGKPLFWDEENQNRNLANDMRKAMGLPEENEVHTPFGSFVHDVFRNLVLEKDKERIDSSNQHASYSVGDFRKKAKEIWDNGSIKIGNENVSWKDYLTGASSAVKITDPLTDIEWQQISDWLGSSDPDAELKLQGAAKQKLVDKINKTFALADNKNDAFLQSIFGKGRLFESENQIYDPKEGFIIPYGDHSDMSVQDIHGKEGDMTKYRPDLVWEHDNGDLVMYDWKPHEKGARKSIYQMIKYAREAEEESKKAYEEYKAKLDEGMTETAAVDSLDKHKKRWLKYRDDQGKFRLKRLVGIDYTGSGSDINFDYRDGDEDHTRLVDLVMDQNLKIASDLWKDKRSGEGLLDGFRMMMRTGIIKETDSMPEAWDKYFTNAKTFGDLEKSINQFKARNGGSDFKGKDYIEGHQQEWNYLVAKQSQNREKLDAVTSQIRGIQGKYRTRAITDKEYSSFASLYEDMSLLDDPELYGALTAVYEYVLPYAMQDIGKFVGDRNEQKKILDMIVSQAAQLDPQRAMHSFQRMMYGSKESDLFSNIERVVSQANQAAGTRQSLKNGFEDFFKTSDTKHEEIWNKAGVLGLEAGKYSPDDSSKEAQNARDAIRNFIDNTLKKDYTFTETQAVDFMNKARQYAEAQPAIDALRAAEHDLIARMFQDDKRQTELDVAKLTNRSFSPEGKAQEIIDKREKDINNYIASSKMDVNTTDTKMQELANALSSDFSETAKLATVAIAQRGDTEQIDKLMQAVKPEDVAVLEQIKLVMEKKKTLEEAIDSLNNYLNDGFKEFSKSVKEEAKQESEIKNLQADANYNNFIRQGNRLKRNRYSSGRGTASRILDRKEQLLSSYEQREIAAKQQILFWTEKQGQTTEGSDEYNKISQKIQTLKEEEAAAIQEQERLSGSFGTVAAAASQFGEVIGRVAHRLGRQLFMKALNETKQFVKQFDASMNEIQAITLKSDKEMGSVRSQTINKALGLRTSVSNVATTEAALYRQGLSDAEVSSRTESIIKFATVTKLNVAEATKIITTALQNDLVPSAEAAMDALVALGDSAATTAAEIGKGMKKAAASAKVAGVSYAELTALLTIGTSDTQLSGTQVGTALQTVFSRMRRLSISRYTADQNGEKTTASDAEAALKSVGVDLWDNKTIGKMRSAYDVLSDLSKVWQNLSDAQKNIVMNAMAGTRQTNVFSTLMEGMSEDGGKTLEKYLGLAEGSEGITQSKYEIAMQSLSASMDELRSSWDAVVESFTNSGVITGSLDIVSGLLQGFAGLASNAGKFGAGISTITGALVGLGAALAVIAKVGSGPVGWLIGGVLGLGVAAGGMGLFSLGNHETEQEKNEKAMQAKFAADNAEASTYDKRIEKNKSLIESVEKYGEAWKKDSSAENALNLKSALSDLALAFPDLSKQIDSSIADLSKWTDVVKDAKKAADKITQEGKDTQAENLFDSISTYENVKAAEILGKESIDPQLKSKAKKVYENVNSYFGLSTWSLNGFENEDASALYKLFTSGVDNNQDVKDFRTYATKILESYGQTDTLTALREHKRDDASFALYRIADELIRGNLSTIGSYEENEAALRYARDKINKNWGSELVDKNGYIDENVYNQIEKVNSHDRYKYRLLKQLYAGSAATQESLSGTDLGKWLWNEVSNGDISTSKSSIPTNIIADAALYMDEYVAKQRESKYKSAARMAERRSVNEIIDEHSLSGYTTENVDETLFKTALKNYIGTLLDEHYEEGVENDYFDANGVIKKEFLAGEVQKLLNGFKTANDIENFASENAASDYYKYFVRGIGFTSEEKAINYAREHGIAYEDVIDKNGKSVYQTLDQLRAAKSQETNANNRQVLISDFLRGVSDVSGYRFLSEEEQYEIARERLREQGLGEGDLENMRNMLLAGTEIAGAETFKSFDELKNAYNLKGRDAELEKILSGNSGALAAYLADDYQTFLKAIGEEETGKSTPQSQADYMRSITNMLENNRDFVGKFRTDADLKDIRKAYSSFFGDQTDEILASIEAGTFTEGSSLYDYWQKTLAEKGLKLGTGKTFTTSEATGLASTLLGGLGREYGNLAEAQMSQYLQNWTTDEWDAVLNKYPELKQYLEMTDVQRKSQEGQNLLRSVEIKMSVSGVSDLEEANKVLEGTTQLLENIQKDGNIEIKAKLDFAQNMYNAQQQEALLNNGTTVEQINTIASLTRLSTTQIKNHFGTSKQLAQRMLDEQKGLTAASLDEIAKKDPEWAAELAATYGYEKDTAAALAKVQKFFGSDYKYDKETGEIYWEKNGLRYISQAAQSIFDNNLGNYVYTGNTGNVERENLLYGLTKKYNAKEIAEAQAKIIRGEMTNKNAEDYELYQQAVSGLSDEEINYLVARDKYERINRGQYSKEEQAAAYDNYEKAQNRYESWRQLHQKEIDEQQALEDARLAASESPEAAMRYARLQYNQNNKGALAANALYETLSTANVSTAEDMMNLLSKEDNLKNWTELLESALGLTDEFRRMGHAVDEDGKINWDAIKQQEGGLSAALDDLINIIAGHSIDFKDTTYDTRSDIYEKANRYYTSPTDFANISEDEYNAYAQIVGTDIAARRKRASAAIGENNEAFYLTAQEEAYERMLMENYNNGIVGLTQAQKVTGAEELFNIAQQGKQAYNDVYGNASQDMINTYVDAVPGLREYVDAVKDSSKNEEELAEMATEVASEIARVNAEAKGYGESAKKAGEFAKAIAKGGTAADKAKISLDAQMKSIQDQQTALEQAAGKSGKQLKTAAKKGDKTLDIFSSMFDYSPDQIAEMSKEQIQDLINKAGPMIAEQFGDVVDGLYAALPDNVDVTLPISDLINVQPNGSVDLSALESVLGETAANIIAEIMSLAKQYGAIDLQAELDKGTLTVEGLFRAISAAGVKGGKGYSTGKGGGGGGGGKSATDKLLEKQKQKIAEYEHQSKLLQAYEKTLDFNNDYGGWYSNISSQIAAQQSLRDAYASNLSELKAQLSTVEAGSDDYNKLADAIRSTEEAMAEISNTINELNKKKLTIILEKHTHEDEPLTHEMNMTTKRSSRYQTIEEFDNYRNSALQEISIAKDQYDQNRKQLGDLQNLLNTLTEGTDLWYETRNEIWKIVEENADLENQGLSKLIELQDEELAQLQKLLNRQNSPLIHERSMLETYTGIAENNEEWDVAREYYRRNIAETIYPQIANDEAMIQRLKEQLATIPFSQPEQQQKVKDEIQRLEEEVAQSRANEQSNWSAWLTSYLTQFTTAVEDATRELNHFIAISGTMSEIEKVNEAWDDYRDSLADVVSAQNDLAAYYADAAAGLQETIDMYATFGDIKNYREAVNQQNQYMQQSLEASKTAMDTERELHQSFVTQINTLIERLTILVDLQTSLANSDAELATRRQDYAGLRTAKQETIDASYKNTSNKIYQQEYLRGLLDTTENPEDRYSIVKQLADIAKELRQDTLTRDAARREIEKSYITEVETEKNQALVNPNYMNSLVSPWISRYQSTGNQRQYREYVEAQVKTQQETVDIIKKARDKLESSMSNITLGTPEYEAAIQKLNEYDIALENARVTLENFSDSIANSLLTEILDNYAKSIKNDQAEYQNATAYASFYKGYASYEDFRKAKEEGVASRANLREANEAKIAQLEERKRDPRIQGTQAYNNINDQLIEAYSLRNEYDRSDYADKVEISDSYVDEFLNEFNKGKEKLETNVSLAKIALDDANAHGTQDEIDAANEKYKAAIEELNRYREELLAKAKEEVAGNVIEGTAGADKLQSWINQTVQTIAQGTIEIRDALSSAGMSALENFMEDANLQLADIGHNLNMIDEQINVYQDDGQFANANALIAQANQLYEQQSAKISEIIVKLKEMLAAAVAAGQIAEGSDDWWKVMNYIMSLEEKQVQAQAKIQQNQNKIKDNERAILQARKELEKAVQDEIKKRIETEKEMLNATVSLQNTILETIRQRYREEAKLVEDNLNKQKQALNEEKNILNKRLQMRKDALSETDRLEEISRLKQQLALISGDTSRTKEAKELEKQIAKLTQEQALASTEKEIEAENERIDDQINAIDEKINYDREKLERYLEDARNFSALVDEIMSGSFDDMANWLRENNKEWKNSLDANQQQLLNTWEDTWKQMKHILENYDAQVQAILKSGASFVEYMKQGDEYIEASAGMQRALISEWQKLYEGNTKANMSGASYTADSHYKPKTSDTAETGVDENSTEAEFAPKEDQPEYNPIPDQEYKDAIADGLSDKIAPGLKTMTEGVGQAVIAFGKKFDTVKKGLLAAGDVGVAEAKALFRDLETYAIYQRDAIADAMEQVKDTEDRAAYEQLEALQAKYDNYLAIVQDAQNADSETISAALDNVQNASTQLYNDVFNSTGELKEHIEKIQGDISDIQQTFLGNALESIGTTGQGVETLVTEMKDDVIAKGLVGIDATTEESIDKIKETVSEHVKNIGQAVNEEVGRQGQAVNEEVGRIGQFILKSTDEYSNLITRRTDSFHLDISNSFEDMKTKLLNTVGSIENGVKQSLVSSSFSMEDLSGIGNSKTPNEIIGYGERIDGGTAIGVSSGDNSGSSGGAPTVEPSSSGGSKGGSSKGKGDDELDAITSAAPNGPRYYVTSDAIIHTDSPGSYELATNSYDEAYQYSQQLTQAYIQRQAAERQAAEEAARKAKEKEEERKRQQQIQNYVKNNFIPRTHDNWYYSAKGTLGLAKAHGTLMGELGPELYVQNGHFGVAGQHGPEFVDLAKDAIVFNHLQTESLLKNGMSPTRGKAVTNEKVAAAYATGSYDVTALRSMLNAFDYAPVVPYMSHIDDTHSDSPTVSVGDININLYEAKLENDADYNKIAKKVGKIFTDEVKKTGLHLAAYSW